MKSKSLSDLGGLVYSSEAGRMCPGCSKPVDQCSCKQDSRNQVVGDGTVRVGRSTAGRKGSGVSTITGVPLGHDALVDLARELKQRCGCGGTVKDGVIEIQGDHRDLLVAELVKRGYKAKKSGG